MRTRTTLTTCLLMGMVLAAGGCGTRARTGGGGAGGAAVARAPSAPLNAAVALVSSEGVVEVRLADGAVWSAMRKDQRVANV